MKRREVLQAILNQLKLITRETPDENYQYLTDIGQNAEYWRTVDHDYNGDPLVTFRDFEGTVETKNREHTILDIQVNAISRIPSGSTKLDTTEDLREDLRYNLTLSLWWVTISDITKVKVVNYEKAIEEIGNTVCQVGANLQVEFREDGLR